tara:strand:- start:86 stop:349 length:264 start_codon:yes stop_codon:yes gene_type:complete
MTTSYILEAREEKKKLKKLRRETEAALAKAKKDGTSVKPALMVAGDSQEEATDPAFVIPAKNAKPKAKPKAKAGAKADQKNGDSDAS